MSTSQSNLPLNITSEDRKKIQNALQEMSNSMTRVEAEKDLMKDIAEKIHDEMGVPKKDFNKLARIFHASNLMEEAARNEEFMDFAEAVMGPVDTSRQIESQ